MSYILIIFLAMGGHSTGHNVDPSRGRVISLKNFASKKSCEEAARLARRNKNQNAKCIHNK